MVLGNSYMSHIHHNGQFPKHLLVYSFIKSKTCPISPFMLSQRWSHEAGSRVVHSCSAFCSTGTQDIKRCNKIFDTEVYAWLTCTCIRNWFRKLYHHIIINKNTSAYLEITLWVASNWRCKAHISV